ncbi:MAG: beta-ketoacyl-ACP synthase II [Spirochaetes bacterium]|nr:beta-ketoacyl-ACP synthase II [Spirochaetota bacterium]MBU0954784.1 beta-ketoacyl-ACP synthase II [Spirochaetota bacterium]
MAVRRVVITGMGTVNPLGRSAGESWQALMAGTSGIGPISQFDASALPVRIAGEVRGLDYSRYFNGELLKKARRMDRFCHLAAAAMAEAAAQAGLQDIADRRRIGISVGSGLGGLNVQHENSAALVTSGARRVSPFYIPMSIGNMASGILSMMYGLAGPNLSPQTACATANHSIGMAQLLIANGMADLMVAGGAESTISELVVAGFSNMRALSTRNDHPESASRPWDADRDGFVMSEGAAILVLEEYEHARRRGADILCEVLSCGMSGDAYDFVMPEPEGSGALYSMQMALELAGRNADQLDYVNAHGTSTPAGDLAELRGLYRLLGSAAASVPVGSTKSSHGHLLGATAGLEAILCIQAMQHGVVPPNRNLFQRDPALPPVLLPSEPIEKPIQLVLSNSFGFGGHNSSLLLGAV